MNLRTENVTQEHVLFHGYVVLVTGVDVWSEHRITWPLCLHRGCGQNIGLHGHSMFTGGVVRT